MFQKFITVFIVTAAIAFAASGLPLSSIFGAGSGSGFFNFPRFAYPCSPLQRPFPETCRERSREGMESG
jgi:hypothetical protein